MIIKSLDGGQNWVEYHTIDDSGIDNIAVNPNGVLFYSQMSQNVPIRRINSDTKEFEDLHPLGEGSTEEGYKLSLSIDPTTGRIFYPVGTAAK